jgi:hypothetical protein
LTAGDYTVRVVDHLSGEAYDDLEVTVPSPETSLIATGGPGQIDVNHLAASHNCCAEIGMDISVDGSTITLREREEGDPCYCTCRFDVSATIRDLAPGEYRVEIPGDEPLVVEGVRVTEPVELIEASAFEDELTVTHSWANWNCCGEVEMRVSLDEATDTILVEEFESYPDGEPCRCTCTYDLGVTASGFPAGSYNVRVFTRQEGEERVFGEVPVHIAGSPGPGSHDEGLLVEPTGDGALTVSHLAAPYNCCSEVVMEAVLEGDTIEVTERIANDELCHCTCEFDLMVELEGLTAGDYTVNVTAADGRAVGSERVTVIDEGPPGPAESIDLSLDGSTLTVTHGPVWMNCCTEIEMSLDVEGMVLNLEEVIANPDEADLCNCICAFNFTAEISGLEVGAEYTLRLWDDGRTTQIHEETFTVDEDLDS